jgi:penicillin-binding protein 1A
MAKRKRAAAKKKRSGGKGKAGKRKRGFLYRTLRFFVVSGLFAGIAVAGVYLAIASRFDMDKLGKMPSRSIVYDVRGSEIGRLHGENRVLVARNEVSPYFVDALLAREDNRYYEHIGVDFIGLGRAILRNVKDRKFVQGASTITMQLARNSYGMTAKSLHRKLIEIALAFRLEFHFSKDELLGHYMNRIFLGSGIYGIEGAAQGYFGKAAKDLTLDEAAMSAGIIRAPNRFSPFRHYDQAIIERDTVLDRMLSTERITQKEADAAKKVKTKINRDKPWRREASWALDAVRRDLNLVLDADDVEDGGLRIYTTIDLTLQKAVETIVEERLREVEGGKGYGHQTRRAFTAAKARGSSAEPAYLQSAVVVIDNEGGEIRAVVGGRDYSESQFNRALRSKRQIGSTFKPFVYAAAIERGLFPGTLIDDSPIRAGEIAGAEGRWSPRNSDGKHLGLQPAAVGLIQSRNTMTVRVGNYAGLDNVLDFAKRSGLGNHENKSAQAYIGNLGATLKELTAAYSVFANSGESQRPFTISKIDDAKGGNLYRSGRMPYSATSPGVSYLMYDMLADVMEQGGTAARARSMGFKSPAGGKTGTTNDFHDAWFVGFTERLTCGAWVGLDEPVRISSGAYGGRLALPIWVDAMKKAEALGYLREVPRARPVFGKVQLCKVSGGLANRECQSQNAAYSFEIPRECIPVGCAVHGGGMLAGNQVGPPVAPSIPKRKPGLLQRIRNFFR